ncbi:MAG: 30S ribosomal protein S6 [Armatimonadetes bacterium]|nr:30S ribosomal protein S6 [Armatimonadota bacterium]NIM22999.1 30S ribosomal protein S6 [Armatimonadota bacterium]NIM66870.1 30S ribosomal protein S6 [Armatimonadota bacterium]NIM75410.1 30S ribosomal protein S6 [Armatimonadota bacterium]NIN05057.1 30S ribosomal protein S6 [Armatimonadota bacterium]
MDKVSGYEIAYVVDAELSPDEISGLKDRIAELAKGQGAEVGEITQWERRRMAYSVRGKREGIYIFMPVKATTAVVAEVVRNLRLAEPVLRHLVIKSSQTEKPPEPAA